MNAQPLNEPDVPRDVGQRAHLVARLREPADRVDLDALDAASLAQRGRARADDVDVHAVADQGLRLPPDTGVERVVGEGDRQQPP